MNRGGVHPQKHDTHLQQDDLGKRVRGEPDLWSLRGILVISYIRPLLKPSSPACLFGPPASRLLGAVSYHRIMKPWHAAVKFESRSIYCTRTEWIRVEGAVCRSRRCPHPATRISMSRLCMFEPGCLSQLILIHSGVELGFPK